jgi:hypothetical protein
MEQYNDTRRWRCNTTTQEDDAAIQRHKKMELLRDSFTDEEERDKD